MGSDRSYGVALLSNAMHQDLYAPEFARHPRTRLLVLADEPGQEPLVVERNRALAARFGVPYIEDVDAALAWPGVDIASVCAQIERRGPLALRAARAGKHLWLDKPLAPDLDECTAVIEALERAGRRSVVVNFLGMDSIQQARRRIEQGDLGDLLAIHADVHFAKGIPDRADAPPAPPAPLGRWTFRPADGTSDPIESGHGVAAKRELFEVGVYAVGFVRYLTGRAIEGVFARAGAHFFQTHADLGIEDFSTLNLHLADGIVASISTGRVGRSSHLAGGMMSFTIVGSRGVLVVDGRRLAAEIHAGLPPDGRPSVIPLGANVNNGLGALMSHFVRVLDGDDTPWADAAVGRAQVATLLAAYRSLASGAVVRPQFG